MGFYIDRETYFQALSEEHYLLKHNQPVSDFDSTPRRTFFRINDEEELNAASANWIQFPCVVQIALSGQLLNKRDKIVQNNLNTLVFLNKVKLDENNPIVATAITVAYDNAYGVMQDFIQRIYADFEENPGCGIFMDIDLGKFRWQQVGPIGDELHGWELIFPDETKAFGSIAYDPENFTQGTTNSSSVREVITFSNTNVITIPYTTLRKMKFGDLPTIDVYINESGAIYKSQSADIILDEDPPHTTQITVRIAGPGSGFIILK